ncbi:MEKHLA domain-containing protein [Pseudonocardia alaniniphila]|uniref:MEKHLA domain-containing protein n=1 Tax=Pseudonocardia alaniniphila TaxID=75291 RepID=UPI0031D59651
MPSQIDAAFAELLSAELLSFERVVGAALLPLGVAGTDEARRLYVDAPFLLLAHDTSADPLFVYANRAAQASFEYGQAALVRRWTDA